MHPSHYCQKCFVFIHVLYENLVRLDIARREALTFLQLRM